LKKYGLVDNSSRGVWALTPEGRRVDQVNPREVKQFVQRQSREARDESGEGELGEQESWRDDLLDELWKWRHLLSNGLFRGCFENHDSSR
jgi:restriction system protein